VAVSEPLYAYMHELLLRETPIDLVQYAHPSTLVP
jgi:hypothetical protein